MRDTLDDLKDELQNAKEHSQDTVEKLTDLVGKEGCTQAEIDLINEYIANVSDKLEAERQEQRNFLKQIKTQIKANKQALAEGTFGVNATDDSVAPLEGASSL